MQIALQDIRTLGYKKISKFYLSNEKKGSFFSDLQKLNTLYYTMKIPAYSLLNKWKLISDWTKADDFTETKEVRGYSRFIYSLEPMIDLESPSNSAKRKCRNTWDSMWDNFGSISELEDYELTLIKDFGLKILFIYCNYFIKDSEELNKLCCNSTLDGSLFNTLKYILDFYNIILTWAIFTQQESNFNKNGLCFIDVLNMLVMDNYEEFNCSLRSIY